MRLTLGRKLFLYTSILLLAVLLGAFAVLERNQARQWQDYLNVQQLAFARFATPELLRHFRGDFNQAAGSAHRQQLKGLLSFNPDLIKFTIYSPSGRVLFDLPPLNGERLPTLPVDRAWFAAALDPVSRTLKPDGQRRLLEVVAPAFSPSGEKVLNVRYLFSFASVDRHLQEMRRTFLLIALIAAVSALFLVALVARRFTRPIHQLTAGVRAVSKGQLQTSIPSSGNDELAILADAFNEMAISLGHNQHELQAKNRQLQQANAELQQIHERLIRTERLVAVGQVAAGVSHEIDNPVGIILGYAELMLEDCPEGDPRIEDLRAIIDECHRCKRITGGLLNLARVGTPRREPVALQTLVRETVESLRPQKLFRRIDVHLPANTALPDVWGDNDRIRQVLVNLLLNAAQFLRGAGDIWIELLADNKRVIMEVHDNGPGFSESDPEKIFEPFFTTKGSREGTGLGLSICRKLVEEHGGEISAAVSPHGGALLIVSLPVRNR
ncbi:MAG: HAMP domain-containing histidine kinase [Deltaproteobacteria bacterium]|nr:HAMP domain-containing histidine kinase [Deltaproteobacteria bacterium]